MIDEPLQITDPKMQAAVAELQGLIRAHYPSTTFTVGEADDPDGVYMRAIVDVDDPDEVAEIFIDRMIDLQVEDGLPIYVVTVRTPERRATPAGTGSSGNAGLATPGPRSNRNQFSGYITANAASLHAVVDGFDARPMDSGHEHAGAIRGFNV